MPVLPKNSLAWSSYLGGDDTAAGLVRDRFNNTFLVGTTSSSNFPTQSALQSTNGGGTSDVFFAELAPLPPPAFTTISNDTGSSSTDRITSTTTQTFSGTSLAGATITLYQAGVGQVATATANSSGNWTSTTVTLTEGTAAFTATQNAG